MPPSLEMADLKSWLHRQLTQTDKLLLVLANIGRPSTIKNVRERAAMAGLRIPNSWNPSTSLRRSKGLAVNTPQGWELTQAGIDHLSVLGVQFGDSAKSNIASGLRTELSRIGDPDTRAFLDEAICCYEAGLHRSAVIMTWVGAVSLLRTHVHTNHLSAFNKEAVRVDAKWKFAKTTDDFNRMKEGDFLDRIAALSIIGNNVKSRLKISLDLRNSCGHPNSLRVGVNTVASHIEVLLLNVFRQF